MPTEPVEFDSEGVTLRGYLCLPNKAGPHPAVVVTHGFGFVKEIFLDHNYPEVLCNAGYAVLVYDHRCTGSSDGEPRQELDPIMQQRGYRDAITYLAARQDIDSDRIGIWGTSYSGGHVLAVAAGDRRVRCVVSQVMTISGRANLERRNSPEQLSELRERWAADRLGRHRGQPAMTLNQVDRQTTPDRQTSAAKFIASLPEECVVNFDDRVTLRTYELYNEYDAAAAIELISPTPLLMIVCSGDETTFADLSLAAYERARHPKRLIVLDGTHMDAYRRHFTTTSSAAVDWFDAHLKPSYGDRQWSSSGDAT